MTDFISAENAVAGSLLIDGACTPLVSSILSENDFQVEHDRLIFQAATELHRIGKRIDAVTVENQLKESGTPVEREILIQLVDLTPTSANAEEYAKIVKKNALRRALTALGNSLIERANLDNPTEIICDAENILDELESKQRGELVTSKQAVFNFWDYRNELENSTGVVIQTEIPAIDKLLGGGFMKGGLYLLAARPGVGKSTLALILADNVAKNGGVLFVTLEMSVEQITAKRIARLTGISSTSLLTQKMRSDSAAYKKITQSGTYLAKSGVSYNAKSRCTVSDIRNMARAVKGLRLVVVDYLGLIRPEGRKNATRYEMVTEISNDLKALAMTLGVPVLALCQLNRANEGRADKRPSLSDLRDSGSLEQDADGVLLLHRDDYYDSEISCDIVPIEVNLAKNRHAGTGTVSLAFELATSNFTEYTRRA